MKNKIPYFKSWYALFLLVCVFWSSSPVWADAPENIIQIEADCLRVDIQDAPLPEVVKALSWESGIEIRLPVGLLGEFITSRMKAKNCSSVVQTLLQDFSMMKFWGDDGHLVAVQLLSRKRAWSSETKPQTISASLVSTEGEMQEDAQVRMEKELDMNQLQTLIDVGKGKTSPPEVINDPVYKPFLLQAGLVDSTNWEDKKKLKALHKQALRAWMKQNLASKSR